LDLLGFLALNLQGIAKIWINNSKMMEGFDFWREAMKSVRSRNEIRRHELLAPIQQPPIVNKLAEVPLALDKWDGILRGHIEAGGRPPTFEEKRAALLKLLPTKFGEDVFFRIPALHESYSDMSADEGMGMGSNAPVPQQSVTPADPEREP